MYRAGGLMIIKENMLKIAANSDISVLLQGETGCGKEVAAHFIHQQSKRANHPFVAVNCGAIAANLAESILEGSRKGAYTGAASDQTGVVLAANHGTLFLDEIGEMPLELQRKLLRILQERSVMPIGTTTCTPVDFRLICATNRNLRHEVAAGRFREDLFFRLNVFPIKIPALRDRNDFSDVALELWELEHTAIPLTCKELQKLQEQQWPGNVRQLKNVLQRYALLKPYGITIDEILQEEFHLSPSASQLSDSTIQNARDRNNSCQSPCNYSPRNYGTRSYNAAPDWETISKELTRNNWNRSSTAKKLGISRGSLNYQIRKHSLEIC